MFRHFSVPRITWAGLVLAIAIGLLSYYTHPNGFDFSFGSPDPCSLGAHSFSIVFHLLIVCTIVLLILRTLLFAIGCLISQYSYAPEQNVRARIVSNIKSSLSGIILLILAALTAPVFEYVLPLKPDPRCQSNHFFRAETQGNKD